MSSSGSGSPAGEQRSAVEPDRKRAGDFRLDAAQLAQGKRRAGGGVGAAPDTGVGPASRPRPGGGDFPSSSRERSVADGARHFKKGCGHLLGSAEMRFRLIEDHREIWPVRVMCEALSVSPSGYYAWRSRPDSPRKIANRALLVDIRRVHAQHPHSPYLPQSQPRTAAADLVLPPPGDLVRTMAPDQTDPNAACASSSQLLLQSVATTT